MKRPRTLIERDWLIELVEESGRVPEISDAGFSFRDETGDFVYEADGRRFEVTILEIKP